MWNVAIPAAVALLSAKSQSDANKSASDQAAQANQQNNALRNQAMPYALDNLKTNAGLQKYYEANPFSDLQKQQYQGLFDTLANNKAAASGLLSNAQNFSQSRGGKMPAMQGLLSATAAPIDWQGMNPYVQIQKSRDIGKNAPMTAQIGQSQDPVWEKVLTDWNKEHEARFGRGLQNTWQDYADPEGTMEAIRQRYIKAMEG